MGGKRALRTLHESVCKHKLDLPLVPSENDADAYIAAYETFALGVKEQLPQNRLLVFSPTDGFLPLCNFLNLPEPEFLYPKLNTLRADAAHLRWQQSYNFKFEFMAGLLALYFVSTMGYWAWTKLQAKKKALIEKANV